VSDLGEELGSRWVLFLAVRCRSFLKRGVCADAVEEFRDCPERQRLFFTNRSGILRRAAPKKAAQRISATTEMGLLQAFISRNFFK
jgi:hypothetical protein